MHKYCEKCRRPHWPKTSIMGWFKCIICGEITHCHIPDERSVTKAQIDKAKQEFLHSQNTGEKKQVIKTKRKEEFETGMKKKGTKPEKRLKRFSRTRTRRIVKKR